MDRLLIKFPTRSRPELFFKTLQQYRDLQTNKNTTYLISIDEDDPTMNNKTVLKWLKKKNTIVCIGHSHNKVDAINRDIHGRADFFDVILVASDDMIAREKGFDDIILKDMAEHFPDGDGCLWYNDSGQTRVCTLPVLGVKYYNRFGYIYHVAYQSLWCDNEYTDVARKLGKIRLMDPARRIITHERPGWGNTVPNDELYIKNDAYYSADEKIYRYRRSKNFYPR